MGEFTKLEQEVLTDISLHIESMIRLQEDMPREKDRLAYLTCLNDTEKKKYTKKEIAKLQKLLHNCNSEVAEYIFALIHDCALYENSDYYKNETTIIKNFFHNFYDEAFDEFVKSPESVAEYSFNFIEDVAGMGNDTILLEEFIFYIAVASRYLKLISFLEIENEAISKTKREKTKEKPADKKKRNSNSKSPDTFVSILTEEKQTFILAMLESIGITVNGKANLSERRKSAIRGIVEALKEKGILPNKSLETLNKIIATAIGLEIKSKLDFTDTSREYNKKAIKYITENYGK